MSCIDPNWAGLNMVTFLKSDKTPVTGNTSGVLRCLRE